MGGKFDLSIRRGVSVLQNWQKNDSPTPVNSVCDTPVNLPLLDGLTLCATASHTVGNCPRVQMTRALLLIERAVLHVTSVTDAGEAST